VIPVVAIANAVSNFCRVLGCVIVFQVDLVEADDREALVADCIRLSTVAGVVEADRGVDLASP